MLFLLNLLQKAQEKPRRVRVIQPKFSQYDMEARHARRGVHCPSCDSSSFNLHVVTLEGEFKCKKCNQSFKNEGKDYED